MSHFSENQRLRYYENISVEIFDDAAAASKHVGQQIGKLIRQNNEKSRSTVLGLATGSTPTQVYEELVRLHIEEGPTLKLSLHLIWMSISR